MGASIVVRLRPDSLARRREQAAYVAIEIATQRSKTLGDQNRWRTTLYRKHQQIGPGPRSEMIIRTMGARSARSILLSTG
jgi:hypothetical protein